jgi:hypothetical protein
MSFLPVNVIVINNKILNAFLEAVDKYERCDEHCGGAVGVFADS